MDSEELVDSMNYVEDKLESLVGKVDKLAEELKSIKEMLILTADGGCSDQGVIDEVFYYYQQKLSAGELQMGRDGDGWFEARWWKYDDLGGDPTIKAVGTSQIIALRRLHEKWMRGGENREEMRGIPVIGPGG